jgi:hypothetical protein
MKRVIASIGLLLLCSAAAFAGEAKAVSDRADLSAFLNTLEARGSCPTPTQAAARKSPPDITAYDACPEGQIIIEDGGCCIGGRQRWERYQCINGVWEHISTSCSGSCF